MHLSFILFSIAAVFSIRLCSPQYSSQRTWSSRWQWALSLFLLPPLLLMITALAVMLMGTDGYMLGLPVGWIGYLLALGFLGYASVRLLSLMVGGWRSLQEERIEALLAEAEPSDQGQGIMFIWMFTALLPLLTLLLHR